MSQIFQHQMTLRAAQYQRALSEVARVAALPPSSAAQTSRAVETLRLNSALFKNASFRRREIALQSWMLRTAVEIKVRSLSEEAREQFVATLRRNPRAVLQLPGSAQALSVMRAEYESLWTLMLSILKQHEKEKRLDTKMARMDARLANQMKEERLELEKSKIEEMKEEAEERFVAAMAAAVTQMMIGMISAAIQVTSAASFAGAPASTPGALTLDQQLGNADAAQKACSAKCLAGPQGDACRAKCESAYIASVAIGLLSQ